MKSKNHRNFETGILSNDEILVNSTIDQIDDLWIGKHCKDCKCKKYCPNPIL